MPYGKYYSQIQNILQYIRSYHQHGRAWHDMLEKLEKQDIIFKR